jgi:hypothetical protein
MNQTTELHTNPESVKVSKTQTGRKQVLVVSVSVLVVSVLVVSVLVVSVLVVSVLVVSVSSQC